MMNSHNQGSIQKWVFCANALLWVLFWMGFFVFSSPAVIAWPPSRAFIVAGRACDLLAPDAAHKLLHWIVFWPSLPSWIVTIPIPKLMLDFYHYGLNLIGFRLVLVCLLSFLQWGLIIRAIQRLIEKRKPKSNEYPSVSENEASTK